MMLVPGGRKLAAGQNKNVETRELELMVEQVVTISVPMDLTKQGN